MRYNHPLKIVVYYYIIRGIVRGRDTHVYCLSTNKRKRVQKTSVLSAFGFAHTAFVDGNGKLEGEKLRLLQDIPVALFMMASKIVLADNAKAGKSPAQIMTDANVTICANNKLKMFVTVWLGILELSTGKLIASNAGHEYPVIKQPDGPFEKLQDKHCFVLGDIDTMKYTEYELTIKPGTKLFLYTDGIPEAENAEDEMFGMDRMLDALNAQPDASPEQTLGNIHKAVEEFVDGAEQFDDLTMLCMEYKGR